MRQQGKQRIFLHIDTAKIDGIVEMQAFFKNSCFFRYCARVSTAARSWRKLSVLKNVCGILILLLLLNGCITIRSFNVNAYDPNQKTPVPIYDAAHADVASGGSEKVNPATHMANQDPPDPSPISYTIHPRDQLDIKFYYNKELNESVTVRPDGNISLQLIHDVQAASLTTNELVSALKKKYSSHIVDPEISVIVRTFAVPQIFIDGQVANPGLVKMGQYMTILQAIASVGGLRETALGNDVLVIRRNNLNKPIIITVDVESARDGTDISQDIAMRPYDIVYVPKSAIANVNTWVDMYIRKNIPINVGYDINNVKF